MVMKIVKHYNCPAQQMRNGITETWERLRNQSFQVVQEDEQTRVRKYDSLVDWDKLIIYTSKEPWCCYGPELAEQKVSKISDIDYYDWPTGFCSLAKNRIIYFPPGSACYLCLHRKNEPYYFRSILREALAIQHIETSVATTTKLTVDGQEIASHWGLTHPGSLGALVHTIEILPLYIDYKPEFWIEELSEHKITGCKQINSDFDFKKLITDVVSILKET